MNVVLKPGVNLIGKLTFARKFQILSVVFLIPVAYGAYALCSSYLDRLNAVELEREGVAMLSSLNNARRGVISVRNQASHWKAVDIASQVPDARQAQMQKWVSAQKQLEVALSPSPARFFSSPVYGKLIDTVKAGQERQLAAMSDPQAIASWWPDAYNIAGNLGKGLNDLSATIVRSHKLNLDPWPETYDLMTLATRSLPEMSELIASMTSTGQGVIAFQGFTLLSRAQLRDTSSKVKALGIEAGMNDFPENDSVELSEWLVKYKTAIAAVGASASSVEDSFFKAKALPADGMAFEDQMLTLQQDVVALQQGALDALDGRLATYQHQARLSFIFTLSAFSALVALAIYILLCVQVAIRRSASGVTSLAEGLRNGDLRGAVVLHGRDELAEIGSALNSAVRQLQTSFININDRTTELNATVDDLSRQSHSSLKAVESQQIQVSLIASAATEMAATAADVARNCEQASHQALEADTVAKQGTEQSQITINSIRNLATKLDGAVEHLESLQEQARQIDGVVAVIKNIADQTNLLALNAAIEAARAGEHGRGFAVVADEVRGLSSRTKESTQVISDTVMGLQKVVRECVIGMQAACSQARTDLTSVASLSDQLENICVVVGRVTGMIQQIAAAAEQQSATADEVSGNVQQIDEMTKVLLSSAEQVKIGTDQLGSGSRQLSGYTAAFRL